MSNEQSNMSPAVADGLGIARTKQADAETAKLEAEALKAGAEARSAMLATAKLEEQERERQATDKYQRILTFEGAVQDGSVHSAIRTLDQWRRLDPGCDITLRFYSPGGDVIAGMYLFDYLMGLRRDGHKLITEASGYAASMAGILLQAGTIRIVGRESYILIHEISFGVRGKVGEVEDEVEFINKVADRVLNIFAARAKEAGEAGTATDPLSKMQFKRRWTRKDWWLTSDEALKYGVVDEVK